MIFSLTKVFHIIMMHKNIAH